MLILYNLALYKCVVSIHFYFVYSPYLAPHNKRLTSLAYFYTCFKIKLYYRRSHHNLYVPIHLLSHHPQPQFENRFLDETVSIFINGDVIAFTTLRLFARATSKKYEYNVDAFLFFYTSDLPR